MRLNGLYELAVGVVVFAGLAAVPFLVDDKAFLDFVIRLAIFSLFALSLNLLIGYTGLVSFGHGLFFGLGSYAFGLAMQSGRFSIPTAFLFTLIVTAVAGVIVGALCVRLTEIYFAFLTLAFQMFLHSLILSWVSITGGDQGLLGGIPKPSFLGIDLGRIQHLYLFSAFMFVACVLLMRQIVQSPFGYALRMLRDNPERASFLGLSVFRYRLAAFVISGVFASVGGILMSLYVSGAYPAFAYWTISGEGIFMIMLGGTTAFLGPITGAAIFLLLNDFVTAVTEYHGLVLGTVILLFVLGLKRGLLDYIIEAIVSRRERARAGQGTP
ncbi:MAG TPA: branched-chain amino acid ABC transporter permease [Alphaproteobacteria bacterium]|nr:branched-chain amino acid ABC transporter permease [Alphaproteobacteria bacterium]